MIILSVVVALLTSPLNSLVDLLFDTLECPTLTNTVSTNRSSSMNSKKSKDRSSMFFLTLDEVIKNPRHTRILPRNTKQAHEIALEVFSTSNKPSLPVSNDFSDIIISQKVSEFHGELLAYRLTLKPSQRSKFDASWGYFYYCQQYVIIYKF